MLPRPVHDYPQRILDELLHWEDIAAALKRKVRESDQYEVILVRDALGNLREKYVERTEFITEETGDPLVDKWIAQMAAGEDPDLDEGLA